MGDRRRGAGLDPQKRTIELVYQPEEGTDPAVAVRDRRVWELLADDPQAATQRIATLQPGTTVTLPLPASVGVTNFDGVGWTLLAAHPMALEVAGVILLLALVGAVVLARRQIELGEDEKAAVAAGHAYIPGHLSGPSDLPDDPDIETDPSADGERRDGGAS